MNRLVWCAEIRTGISLVDPNDNLASAYFKKAENALEAMHSVHPKEWKISTGYYSLYFSLYAVLMKIGIRSENHICSLEVMRGMPVPDCDGLYLRQVPSFPSVNEYGF